MVQKTAIFILLFFFLISFQSYGQAERDTLFYELETEMIAEARIDSINMKVTEYFVVVRLKEEYHAEYEKLTADNVGNLLGVIYNEELISPTFPAIQAKIKGGSFSIGDYKEKEEAIEVKKQILNEDEKKDQ